MKTTHRLFRLLAIAAAVVACAEKQETPESDVQGPALVPMTFSGSLEEATEVEGDSEGGMHNVATKTTYSGRNIFWEKDDAISVFFIGNDKSVSARQSFKVSSRSANNSSAVFEGHGLPAAGSYLAVYPDLVSNTYDGSAVSVTIPSEQKAVANGFSSGANVSLAYSQDESLYFRNACALLAFRFDTEESASRTKSLTFRARNAQGRYVGLTGSSIVTLDADNRPVAGEGSVDHVTLTAPDGGFAYRSDLHYYLAVYPFECTSFEISLTDTDDRTYTLRNNTTTAVARNTGLSFGQVPQPYVYPAQMTFTLDFKQNTWPFISPCVLQAAQTTAGEVYKLTYSNATAGNINLFDFVISKGSGPEASGYKFGPKSGKDYSVLIINSNKDDGAWVRLPAIPGRYLKQVKLTHCNIEPKYFRVQTSSVPDNSTSTYYYSELKKAESGSEFVELDVTFPTVAGLERGGLRVTEENTSYYIYFPEQNATNVNVGTITVVYTDTKPVSQ